MAGVESMIVEEKQAPSRSIDREKVTLLRIAENFHVSVKEKTNNIYLFSDLSIAAQSLLQLFWSTS